MNVIESRNFRFLFLLTLILVKTLNLTGNPITLAEDGYKIKVQLTGITDTVCYLANYYGDKTYLTDTAFTDSKGRFTFEGDSALPGGVYIIAGQSNNKFLEIIIDRSQHFSVTADIKTIMTDVKFEKSEENVLFFDFIQYNMKIRKEIDSLRKRLKNEQLPADSIEIVKQRIEFLSKDIDAYPGKNNFG